MDEAPVRSGRGVLVLAEAYLAAALARRYSPCSIQMYRQAIRDFDLFLEGRGVREAREVTPAVIEAYRRHLRSRRFSPASEETYCRGIKRFFDALERRQRVFENPFAGTGPLRREHKQVPVPSEAEIQTLLAVPDVSTPWGLRDRALIEVAYGSGARLEELARMKRGDIDLANGTLRILGKGRRERVVPLGKPAVVWLERYLTQVRAKRASPGTDMVWIGLRGPITRSGIGLAIRACALKANTATAITPHGLRRACVTHMLAHGAHPVELQMLLGHASLTHLSAYLRVSFRELKAMHERSRLGQ